MANLLHVPLSLDALNDRLDSVAWRLSLSGWVCRNEASYELYRRIRSN